MMRCSVFVVLLCLAVTAGHTRESLNFYVPDTEAFPEDKQNTPKADEPKSKRKVEPKPAEKVTSTPTPKPSPPQKDSTAVRTPASNESDKNKKPASAMVDLQIRSSQSTKSFDPPLDPYGIARAFSTRWDFSSFLVSAEEELKFRLDAARARTLRLARAFSALSDEVETRQRNLNAAALAAYLLAQDQHSWVPVEGRNLTEAQMLAVRYTMRQDIAAMNSALHDYEVLRNTLNASVEDVAALEKSGLSSFESEDATQPDSRITIPTSTIAARQTQSILAEHLVPLEALKAALAAENMRSTGERRQSIASFAPPPPEGRVVRPRTSPQLPEGPSEEVMKLQPKGESVPEPEKTALVFETPINAPVQAVQSGVIVYAGPFRGYGNMIIIEHEKGLFSVYSHLENVQVLERQPVRAGDTVGRAGNPPELGRSGIHFQVRRGKEPLKPETWLKTQNVQRLLTKM